MKYTMNPLLSHPGYAPRRKVVVIGAGAIGPDIAYYLLSDLPGLERLVLIDVVQSALDSAKARIESYVEKAKERGRMGEERAARVMARLDVSTDYDAVRGADWVLESATENLPLKRQIFSRVEALVAADCWITSNSSSLPASEMFEGMKYPARAAVTHFFSPAWRNPIVEVASTGAADPALVAALRHLFAASGKVPLATADVTCFMLDRIFDNWCNEAALLLDKATAAEIDSVLYDYVQAGPFFVLNMARGNPIVTAANGTQARIEGDHYAPAPIFRSVASWKTLPLGGRCEVDASVRQIITDRMIGILLSQSYDILDRGIGSAADLEIGCRLALGFKAGPLALARSLGDGEVARILARLSRERPGLPMPEKPASAYVPAFETILVDDIEGVRVLTMRRPEALNALHDGLTDELLAAIRQGENDPEIQGFVITGYGAKAFSAGADIGRFVELLGDAEASADYSRACSRLLLHLDRIEKPVVAALNGFALGGGLELAFRCHSIIATSKSYLQLPEITLGIAPGIGAMVVPFRRWPKAVEALADMLLQARQLQIGQARDLGIVDAVVDAPEDLVGEAIARVKELSQRGLPRLDQPVAGDVQARLHAALDQAPGHDPEVHGIIVEAVRAAAAASSLAEGLELGYRAFGATACTEAARRKITAFMGGA